MLKRGCLTGLALIKPHCCSFGFCASCTSQKERDVKIIHAGETLHYWTSMQLPFLGQDGQSTFTKTLVPCFSARPCSCQLAWGAAPAGTGNNASLLPLTQLYQPGEQRLRAPPGSW